MKPRPLIALTPGEPAGIGPDITLSLLQGPLECDLVLIADPELLQDRARLLGLPFAASRWDHLARQRPAVSVFPVALARPVLAGQLDPANSAYVLDCLRHAVQGCQRGDFDALVTGPVHKGVINDAGFAFTGHTEFLAAESGTPQVVMMLAAPGLRVALATTHLPLSAVSRAITREHLTGVLRILHADLRTRLGIAQPRIRVCGLNPHAGEAGHLGREEIEVMEPVLEGLRAEGFTLLGPVPADTAFLPAHRNAADAVLAMYHDQGLPVLKTVDFAHAVNITLGLPFIRTSVDHGTALELAGRGQAEMTSLHAALRAALDMVHAARHADTSTRN